MPITEVKADGYHLSLLPVTTITTAVSATAGTTFVGLHGTKYVALQANFTYGSGGTSAKVYLQTSFDLGTTWTDIACIAFTTTSLRKMSVMKSDIAVTANTTASDGALTDNTILDGVFGDRFRLKYVTTGTYAGGTTLQVDAILKG